MLNVLVNNETHQVDPSTSLLQLIHRLEINTKGIAIAINQSVVPQPSWNSTLLQNNDDILIITATQGG